MYYQKPKPKITKKQVERWHAQKRVAERFGLPQSCVNKIRRMILHGQSEFIKAQSNHRTLHLVNYEGTRMIAVYDKLRKEIITLLQEKTDETLSPENTCSEMAASGGLSATS